MSDIPRPRPGILEIAPYVGGQSKLAGHGEVLKLSSNENPLGPGPASLAALRALVSGNEGLALHRYPDSGHGRLRAAIAGAHELDAERVICGVGSDEIITLLCQAYAGPGDEVLYSAHGFLMYRISALAAGATPVAVPERERCADVDALLAAAGERTKLVFLANPNNPTGAMVAQEDVRRLAEGLPPTALLVLDGAYAEYVEGFDGGAALVEARQDVVMTRTFSKIYGLGGLRVGWGYGPAHVIEVLNRIRPPFNLSDLQQEIAIAALGDAAHVQRSRLENAQARDWLTQALRDLGLAVDDSAGNFVLARFASAEAAVAADAVARGEGIILRRVEGYGFPEGLRITVGTMGDCRRVVAALRRAVEQGA
ncbi:MAG: histidinol-phosphate transaminase [Pararhodobacter sp.]|nr:histidinol-phosphate transaminase [Pararhodobacter sp.]